MAILGFIMFIEKYVKYSFFFLIIISLFSCSQSFNMKSYGFGGSVERQTGTIAIKRRVDLEPNTVKTKETIKKIINYENKTFKTEERVATLFLSDREYELGKKVYENIFMIRRLQIFDWDLPSLLDGYYTLPFGVVDIYGRKCLLILHDSKIKSESNLSINGSLKGYQLIDIESNLEVELNLKMVADINDTRILTYSIKRELFK